jgi:hypothetical protein
VDLIAAALLLLDVPPLLDRLDNARISRGPPIPLLLEHLTKLASLNGARLRETVAARTGQLSSAMPRRARAGHRSTSPLAPVASASPATAVKPYELLDPPRRPNSGAASTLDGRHANTAGVICAGDEAVVK